MRKEIKEKIVLRERLSEFNDRIDRDFKLNEGEINKMLEYLELDRYCTETKTIFETISY